MKIKFKIYTMCNWVTHCYQKKKNRRVNLIISILEWPLLLAQCGYLYN